MIFIFFRYKIPSRKHFTDSVIPEMYRKCRESLQSTLDTEMAISFTIDTWTADHTCQSFLGVTAHWINSEFEGKSSFIGCEPLHDRHTSFNLSDELKKRLLSWNISIEKCHVVIKDNAANITKASALAGVDSKSCFIHSLQLCIQKAFSLKGQSKNNISRYF